MKWKILKFLCYLQIAITAFIVFYILYNAWNDLGRFLKEIYTYIFFFVTGLLIVNSLVNLYIYEKYFPDQPLPGWVNIWCNILFFFLCIISAFIFFLMLRLYFEGVSRGNRTIESREIWAFVLTGLLVITSIPLGWLQINLRKTIKRNYQLSLDSFFTLDQP